MQEQKTTQIYSGDLLKLFETMVGEYERNNTLTMSQIQEKLLSYEAEPYLSKTDFGDPMLVVADISGNELRFKFYTDGIHVDGIYYTTSGGEKRVYYWYEKYWYETANFSAKAVQRYDSLNALLGHSISSVNESNNTYSSADFAPNPFVFYDHNGKKYTKKIKCPECGTINDGKVYCEKCGYKITDSFKKCNNCGAAVKKDKIKCPHCKGTKFTDY